MVMVDSILPLWSATFISYDHKGLNLISDLGGGGHVSLNIIQVYAYRMLLNLMKHYLSTESHGTKAATSTDGVH